MKNTYTNKTSICIRTGLAVALIMAFTFCANAQKHVRKELQFPDFDNYKTLKCDFHTHTVFSDGRVWPTIRIIEAWKEGLDAIAISDHIEYQPHKDDVSTDYSRPYEIARSTAHTYGITLIKSAELTHGEPPGHFNALFLKEIAPLKKSDYKEAVKAAIDQGAFVFWNHPGWKQPGHKSVWYDEQEILFTNGWTHGIETVNGYTYYPKAHKWCMEKNLAIIGNSDVHLPISMDYDFAKGEHRPMTLVFAKDQSQNSIKEALFARRTAVYWENKLIGNKKFLKPIFKKSIEITPEIISLRPGNDTYIRIHNRCELDFILTANGNAGEVSGPGHITLPAGKTVLARIKCNKDIDKEREKAALPYRVENLLVAPDTGLEVNLELNVKINP